MQAQEACPADVNRNQTGRLRARGREVPGGRVGLEEAWAPDRPQRKGQAAIGQGWGKDDLPPPPLGTAGRAAGACCCGVGRHLSSGGGCSRGYCVQKDNAKASDRVGRRSPETEENEGGQDPANQEGGDQMASRRLTEGWGGGWGGASAAGWGGAARCIRHASKGRGGGAACDGGPREGASSRQQIRARRRAVKGGPREEEMTDK